MTQLTQDQVRHIATLARLRLSDEEVTRFAPELTSILGFVEQLQEVDTSNVEATAQATGKRNALREDVVRPLSTPEGLLGTSSLPIVERQIQTPSAHG